MTITGVTEQLVEDKSFNKKVSKIWLIFEALMIIFMVMGSIINFWLNTTYPMTIKFIITTLAGIIIYDVFKGFIYVRYILIK